MDTSKMREEFELNWLKRYPAHGKSALIRSRIHNENYVHTRVNDAWWSWQASREAVAVELPAERRIRHTPMPDENSSYNEALENCRDIIEAQGLKVKP